jgi:hypothetical protein
MAEMAVAKDVPPPPAQMDAVLMAFESAAEEKFPVESEATSSSSTTAAAVTKSTSERVSVRPKAVPKRWTSLLWIGGAAAGLLVAAGIVRAIAFNQHPPAIGPAVAPSAPTAVEPEARAASANATAPVDKAVPSEPPAVEPKTRTPAVKSAPKTVRSPRKPSKAPMPSK